MRYRVTWTFATSWYVDAPSRKSAEKAAGSFYLEDAARRDCELVHVSCDDCGQDEYIDVRVGGGVIMPPMVGKQNDRGVG
jgi:hypothetical protein